VTARVMGWVQQVFCSSRRGHCVMQSRSWLVCVATNSAISCEFFCGTSSAWSSERIVWSVVVH